MPTSARGSETAPTVRPRGAAGFTLIELIVVVALIAIASAVASLALRDPAATRLDHEGARLVALLEAARNEARAAGLTANWLPRAEQDGVAGFRFVGMPASSELPSNWLTEGVTAEVAGATSVVLGPEPMIGAQRIVLRLDDHTLTLATDGLGPFVVVDDEAPAAARP
jgi:general secretion pathway protein H